MSLFRRLFAGSAGRRSRRRLRDVRRAMLARGLERLEGRRVYAGLAPADLALSPSDIDENLPAGTTVGSFTATDADSPSGSLVYSFEGGAENLDNERFFLTGNVLKTRESFDFENVSSYQVSVKAKDAEGNSLSKVFTVGVNNVVEAPIAHDDALVTEPNTPVSGNVLVNDRDDVGAGLTVSLEGEPAGGTVELNSDGSFTYTPAADFNGTDSFTYTIADANGATDTATVSIVVGPINDLPVAADDAAAGSEDAAITGNVLENDADPDGDELTAALGTAPTSGALELEADGSFTYTPHADFNGTDSFTYTIDDGAGGTATGTVTISISPVQDAPVSSDDEATAAEDSPAAGNVLINDLDVDGDALSVSLAEGPSHGTVALESDGSFVYTPSANFTGPDSFTYMVDDGNGGTASGTVNIMVTPVSDAPVALGDEASGDEDTPIAGNVLVNDTDSDGDALTATLGDSPANGTVVLNADGSFTYTPSADFNGTDSFTYTVDDGNGGTASGSVVISVRAVNDAPIAADDEGAVEEDEVLTGNVLDNDTDADGDTLTVGLEQEPTHGVVELAADGSFTYTPDRNYNGPDSFTYGVDDGHGGMATATVNIAISAVDDLPAVVDDSVETDEDMPAVIPIAELLANDSDAEGNPVSLVAVGGAVNGTVMVSGENVVFTPSPDFHGIGSFVYAVQDESGGYAFATVTVAVEAVNDVPVAVHDSATTSEGLPLSIPAESLVANDTDAEGDALSVVAVGGAEGGSVSLADGVVTFTPAADFSGQATFHYIADDGNGGFALGRVTVEVLPSFVVNTPPEAVDDTITADGDGAVMIAVADLLANDLDADGDALSLTAVGNAVGGRVRLMGDYVRFRPDCNSGAATFTYTIDDGHGGTDTGSVTIAMDDDGEGELARMLRRSRQLRRNNTRV